MKTKLFEVELKDKKIKYFRIVEKGDGLNSNKVRQYLHGEFWAHYQSITGGEYASGNSENSRRQAIFTVNNNTDINETYFIEDLRTEKIYNIKFIDDKEGYKGDLKISVIETTEAAGVPNEQL